MALAFAGFSAMPFAAQAAAADVTLTNVCGGAGQDYIQLPKNTGKYTIQTTGLPAGDIVVDTDAAGITATPGTTGLSGATATNAQTSLDASGTKIKVTLPDQVYDTTGPVGSRTLLPTFAIYDSSSTKVAEGVVTAANITDATCSVQSIPAPFATLAASPATSGGTITVTKGTGLVWTVTDGTSVQDGTGAAVNAKITNAADVLESDNKTIKFPAGAGPDATVKLQVSDSTRIIVTASPAPGYTGVAKNFDFKLDAKQQVTYVAPTKSDVDGKANDTFTVKNIPGVTWYYNADPAAVWTDPAAATAEAMTTAMTANTAAGWKAIVPQAGADSTTVTRPGDATTVKVRAQLADFAKYKWDAADTAPNTAKVADQTFTNTTKIVAIPAPTLVDGPGNADYYILPKVDGLGWTVTSTRKDGTAGPSVTYSSTDSRLGTQVPVFTTMPPETYTFTAVADTANNYEIDTTKVTKSTWTQVFDNRAAVTPEGPKWIDATGLVNDAVTFPAMQSGLKGYEFAITSGTTQPQTADWRFVDFTWYGKTVSLTDLQKAIGANVDPATFTHVWVRTAANDTTAVLANDAKGNPVTSAWDYNFTNAMVVTPVAPVQTPVAGGSSYTLTFPNDPTVIYSVTDANGVTKDIAATDLGKALPYSGIVTVKARSASPGVYVIAPNPDGSAPTPWTFKPTTSTPLTPMAPVNTTTTYTLPVQEGVVWYVDGVAADPATLGKPQSNGGKTSIVIKAMPASGFTFADGAQTTWTLDFKNPTGSTVTVTNQIVQGAQFPTTLFTWSAPNAVSYTTSYQKINADGTMGPEIAWLKDTTATSSPFIAMPGDHYRIYVTAKDTNGVVTTRAASDVTFAAATGPITEGWTDLNSSTATYVGTWKDMRNLNLPYYNDSVMIGYNGVATLTLPAGTKYFELYGTVFANGGAGTLKVNGTNWADFTTNGTLDQPYKQMLRRLSLPDTGAPITISIVPRNGTGQYLALDAYKAMKL